MSVDITYFRIGRIIRSGAECFLCALEDEIERKYIDTHLSELVMDTKAREKLVQSGGFCNHHFYRMLAMATRPDSSDGHGIALITQSIIEKTIQDLQKQRKLGKENFPQTTAELLQENRRGTGFGLLSTINGIGDFTSSVTAGILWASISASAAFAFGAALAVAATTILMIHK